MNLLEQETINDVIRDAVCRVSLSYDIGPHATVALVDAVRDDVEDFLLDQQFENEVEEDVFGDLEHYDVEEYEDASEYEIDPEVLMAQAEQFVHGCERVDFLVQEIGLSDNELRGMRDRLIAILGTHG